MAATLFRRKGYAATTTREIAAKLGIQKASLYYHIPSKESLLYRLSKESLAHAERAIQDALATVDLPENRLREAILAHVKTVLSEQDRHATMLTELRALTGRRRSEVVALRDRYEALIRRVIEEAQQAGVLRRDVDAKYLGLFLLGMSNWSIFWFRSGQDLTSSDLAETLVAMFLEGAGVPRISDTEIREERHPTDAQQRP